jgi:hypothetical protein
MRFVRNDWRNLLLVILVLLLAGYVHRLQGDMSRLRAVVFDLELERARKEAGKASPLLADFQLDLPGRGEVFPAMTAAEGAGAPPLALLRVTNAAQEPMALQIDAVIPGWSRSLTQTEIVGPQETRQVRIDPPLLPAALRNEEIRTERLQVQVEGVDGKTLFAESRPVLIHGGSDLLWGKKFVNAQAAARWVTPHDPAVLELVSRARSFVPRGRLAGYGPKQGDQEVVGRQVDTQAEAVFRAMQASGLSYVNSLAVMGDYLDQAQRVRLPRETLALKTANCVDVSVAFASAMENLGLQPLLVLVPGHAVVGVRRTRDSEDVLYLDLTVLPDGGFDQAAARARRWVEKTPPEKLLVVDVLAARSLGYYPLVASDAPPS